MLARDARAAVAVALGLTGADALGGSDPPLLAARVELGAWDRQGVARRTSRRAVVRCIGASRWRMAL
jgi:hypothetical protein